MQRIIRSQIVPIESVPGPGRLLSHGPWQPVVLVADDRAIIVDTLAQILSREGFQVLRGYGGPHALELASATPPDLLITDVFMPELSGPELALEVLANAPQCKVLFLSGNATRADLLPLQAAGYSVTLLPKPVPPAELIRHARHALSSLLPDDFTAAVAWHSATPMPIDAA